jgi:hypothetical protein
LPADCNAQEILQPYASPILHAFLDSANVYPESVTVDQSSGTFFVGSVKEGTIYKGKIGRPSFEVFSPGGADGRTIATGMFSPVVVGRQTGLRFVYNTKNGRLISKLDNGLRAGQTFLNHHLRTRWQRLRDGLCQPGALSPCSHEYGPT